MKFKALWKDTFREIGKSKMRFLAILTIILLGVAFFVGISATGPDMVHTADQYYEDLNLMDYKVQSSYGLTEDDIESLEELDDISVQSHYAYDFLLGDATSMRLFSYNPQNGQDINQYYLLEGRLPNKSGEIAIDNKKYLRDNVSIGDTIVLEEGDGSGDPDEKLEHTQFEVVGRVNSPLFIEIPSRGVSTIGSGTLNAFGVILKADYKTDTYTEAYLKIDGSEEYQAYSDDYQNYITSYKPALDDKLEKLANHRETSIIDEAQKDIDQGWADIEEAKKELADAKSELKKARKELDEGWQEFEEGKKELAEESQSARQEIANNEKKLREGAAELERNKDELLEKKDAIQKQQADLKQNEKELDAGISQIEEAIPQVDQGLNEINQNLPSLKAGITEIQKNRTDLQQKKNEIQQALELPQVNHEQINQQIDEIDEQIAQLKEDNSVPEEKITELENKRNELKKALSIPEVNHNELNSQLNEVEKGLNELATKEKELKEQRSSLLTQKEELEAQKTELTQELSNLKANQQELIAGKEEIKSGLEQINNGLAQINEREDDIQSGFNEIAEAKNTLAEETATAQNELDKAETELNKGETDYEQAVNRYEAESQDALAEIEDAEDELLKAEAELDDLTSPEYQSFDRSDNMGYSEYNENAERLSVIANVFPVFFFLIAVFISFTTMTRMVDEEREYIGIMKAMGYKNRHILIKFIVYASVATIVGSLLGLVIGYTLFPQLIFYAYSSMYNFPAVILQQYSLYTIIALVFAFISTVGASLLAARYALRSNAAQLLQPKPPKKGSRIWLERLSFIWDRLSFNYKITFRNVFRYKSRMLMTILGIAGSTGLILTGFGISDSIGDIPDIQYGEINQFQAYVALNPNADTASLEDYEQKSQDIDAINDELFVLQQNVQTKNKNISTQDIAFFVPQNPDKMNDFVQLSKANNNDAVYDMNDSGVYLTEKIADLLDLTDGDSFDVSNADDEVWTVKVAGIVENYMEHFAYMTPDYYKEVTGEDYNQSDLQLIKFDEETVSTDQLGSELMDYDAVAGIQYVDDIYDAFAGSLESLDLITQILVISAAALAFIVLYNLTNINVSERRRELSTIKVLGSYDYEVTMYIYRENIILTLMGILVGLGFGKLLTSFIMDTMEIDTLVFGRTIYASSYLYASLLTILFTLIVMLVIHFQLKKIDMVEALKGND